MKWQLISKSGKRVIEVKKDEEVGVVLAVDKGGCYEVGVELKERGARALILGVVLGKGQYKAKIIMETRHWVSNTHAETIIYGTNRDESETELKGLIKIDKKANQVTDFLTAKVLLLSDRARATVEPGLEIKSDEVRASHAATVAAIDEEQIYYLMSRGLERLESERLIADGFFQVIINKIDNVKIRKQICLKLK
ncbi:MAG: SufD family Fe-S cluster assembly protein [Patescibacteria group bacterium]|nr:SufD family Fe-S cluster assembly protein [Patescibacteria group bacterium]